MLGWSRPTIPTLVFFILVATSTYARADEPPPSQELSSDPGPPFPRLGLGVDGLSIALGDYAARVEGAPERWHALWAVVGATRRHGVDAILLEAGWSIWPLSWGLEGLYVTPVVGADIPGPWSGDGAMALLRAGGELGWQILWADVSITLGAGAMAIVPLEAPETVWPEPRLRIALGFVMR